MCATSTVTRDLESGYVNVGSYRFKLIDETTCVGHLASGHHGDIISKNTGPKGKAVPWPFHWDRSHRFSLPPATMPLRATLNMITPAGSAARP